jgi:hypothetical protein
MSNQNRPAFPGNRKLRKAYWRGVQSAGRAGVTARNPYQNKYLRRAWDGGRDKATARPAVKVTVPVWVKKLGSPLVSRPTFYDNAG